MKHKRFLSLALALLLVLSCVPMGAKAADDVALTANQAVDEMTWGVNLVDLYIAEPEEDLRRQESTTGYIDYQSKETYDLGIGIWFWDNSFQWVCSYPTEKQDTIQISVPIPDYDAAIAEANEGWAFFIIRCGDKTGGNDYKITLSDCRILAADGTTVLKDTYQFGSNGDGVLTASGTTTTEEDGNGWYWGYGSQENNWTGEIGYFAGDWDENTQQMGHGADPKYNGATFTATLKIETAKTLPSKSKAEYYYCVNRLESDYRELVDTYMAEGVNVFRLPVTWTWFTQNEGEFTIDREWLAVVKETVDYILSKGAYCILNTHNDYLQYSYVAESDGNGGYTNFHWEDQWMGEQYKDYVDARFEAIWEQIAVYFQDCSDHLIFEACNEPAMLWYSGVNYDPWIAQQENRVNELNEIFVDTVRKTGGENANRILCLAVAEYNIHTHLDAVELPEDSDYLMIQIHSYNELENTSNGESWRTATDDLFADVASFREEHPKVPVIIGEVGISHSYENINNPEIAAEKVSYFVEKAEALGVPCLWWEDYFLVPEGGATSIFWIYDKANKVWRTEILEAIRNALNDAQPGEPDRDEVIRVSGANRFDTAIQVADEMKSVLEIEKFDAVILANGYNFADALAGSYLSTVKDAPILLTWNGAEQFNYLNDATIQYVKDNLKPGGTVYILGGTAAVPASIDAALSDFNIARMDGANRFETNIMILEEAGVEAGSEILVCTSTNFADSLSASAAGKPILLVYNEGGKLFDNQKTYLEDLENCTFTVVGGESAVSAGMLEVFSGYGETTRLAGSNRFETSVLVAEKYFPDATSAVLAYAWDFPDGLCGGGLANAMGAPLILTMTNYESQAVDYIRSKGIAGGIVLGGEKLISDESMEMIFGN